MKNRKLLVVILLAALVLSFLGSSVLSCGGSKDDNANLFSIDSANMKGQYQPQETLSLSVTNEKQKEMDSVAWFVNDKRVGGVKGSTAFSFPFAGLKLG